MHHNSLSLCRHTSMQQKLSADLNKKLEKLMNAVKTLQEPHNLPDDLVINMDKKSLCYVMPQSSTVTKKGTQDVHIRGTKGRKKCLTYLVSRALYYGAPMQCQSRQLPPCGQDQRHVIKVLLYQKANKMADSCASKL